MFFKGAENQLHDRLSAFLNAGLVLSVCGLRRATSFIRGVRHVSFSGKIDVVNCRSTDICDGEALGLEMIGSCFYVDIIIRF